MKRTEPTRRGYSLGRRFATTLFATLLGFSLSLTLPLAASQGSDDSREDRSGPNRGSDDDDGDDNRGRGRAHDDVVCVDTTNGTIVTASRVDNRDENRLRARLVGPRLGSEVPSGHADWKQRTDRIKFSTEVEDVDLPDDTVLVVTVKRNSTMIHSANLPDLQMGFADLDQDLLNGDSISEMQVGDLVEAWHNGDVILSGVFDTKQ